MATDGRNIARLTSNLSYDDYPAWSPDGSMIAFASDRDSQDSNRLELCDEGGRHRCATSGKRRTR